METIIHNVSRVRFEKAVKFVRSNDMTEFYIRKIFITASDGQKLTISMFSDDKKDLNSK